MQRTGSLYTASNSLKLPRCSERVFDARVHCANKQHHCDPTKMVTTHRSSSPREHTHMHTRAHVHTCTHASMYIYILICANTHSYMQAHTHTHTDTYVHTMDANYVHISYHNTSSALACQWHTWWDTLSRALSGLYMGVRPLAWLDIDEPCMCAHLTDQHTHPGQGQQALVVAALG